MIHYHVIPIPKINDLWRLLAEESQNGYMYKDVIQVQGESFWGLLITEWNEERMRG